MRKTISLPMLRVNGLAAETKSDPESAVSNLLSVLFARRMWAHFDADKSSAATAVFICSDNVPTLKKNMHPREGRSPASRVRSSRLAARQSAVFTNHTEGM